MPLEPLECKVGFCTNWERLCRSPVPSLETWTLLGLPLRDMRGAGLHRKSVHVCKNPSQPVFPGSQESVTFKFTHILRFSHMQLS